MLLILSIGYANSVQNPCLFRIIKAHFHNKICVAFPLNTLEHMELECATKHSQQ